MTRILFRCDGNESTGLGHVSRCVGLAEAAAELGATPVFVGHFGTQARMLLAEAKIAVAPLDPRTGTADDAGVVSAFAAAVQASRVVVDGYAFGEGYLQRLALAPRAAPLFIVDDAAALRSYPAGSCVLSSTARGESLHYSGEDLTVLRGPRYLLLRRSIRTLRRARPLGTRLLVAVGAVDPSGGTMRLVRALAALGPHVPVDAVLRGDAPGRDAVARAVTALPQPTRVFGWLPHLAHRYADAFGCITTGGLTKYEARYLGLPVATICQSSLESLDTEQMGPGEVTDLTQTLQGPEPELERAISEFVHSAVAITHDPPPESWGDDPTLLAASVLVRGWPDFDFDHVHDAPTAPPF